MSTAIGLAATVLILWSSYLIGEKRTSGFIVSIVGQVLWFIRGLIGNLPDILVTSSIFAVLAVWNYWKWTHETSLSTDQRH